MILLARKVFRVDDPAPLFAAWFSGLREERIPCWYEPITYVVRRDGR